MPSEPWSLFNLKRNEKPEKTGDKVLESIGSKLATSCYTVNRLALSHLALTYLQETLDRHIAGRGKLNLASMTTSNSVKQVSLKT